MKKLLDFLHKIEPSKEKQPFMHTLFDGFFTFLFAPKTVTANGVHVRDGMDLKRTMVHVVIAMQLCYVIGTYNIGHQHFAAIGEYTAFLEGFHLKLAYGLSKLLPIFIVAHVVGLGVEFFYAAKKGHPIEEGFLVSGALIPLIMPPDLPLWILTIAVLFAVIIGKEAFGGTGMNIWNVALLARVFVFFAYPTTISGDQIWIAGFDISEGFKAGAAVDYGWIHTGVLNPIFEFFNLATYDATATIVDGVTGATPLGLAAQDGMAGVNAYYSNEQIFWGAIPGSIGETSVIAVLFGAIFLLVTKIASWRIMLSMLIGGALTAMLLNAWGSTPLMTVPWEQQLWMGSFLFAMVFMATDPVTAASTNTGKWIYGFMIGMVGMVVRVLNPAYPEGWMLAILFMNTFAALIDHYVLEANIKKRLSRA